MIENKKNPIAIVGAGLRLPSQIHNLDELWAALCNEYNCIEAFDKNRFDYSKYQHPKTHEKGKSYTFKAGMLKNIYDFDASLFGISAREAEQMDPQQRLLLETTWEAFENGGQNIDDLRGSSCAVYVGIGSNEHPYHYVNDTSASDSYTMLGNCASIAANRLSYCYDLRGPSMSIDTACSSSLVALHQACESIRHGTTATAIAAGVNILQSPTSFIGFSKASMLSPDGQCKSFSDGANGYVRSEGCVVLYLKSLDLAVQDNDPIHAVILNSNVNNDGRTNGIILPSAQAQADLIQTTMEQIGICADDIAYIEAHGTGTQAGDQAETNSIYQAIAAHRTQDRLQIGSVKSNMGHLEVASGLLGVLKSILCLKHKQIPKTLHFKTPNPNIPFDDMNLRVVNNLSDIPKQDQPLVIGVNSFGFGGTNAHTLLGEHKQRNPTPDNHSFTPPLIISTTSDEHEISLLRQYAELLTAQQHPYPAIANSAYYRKAKHSHGIAIYGDQPCDIQDTLNQAVEDGIYGPNIVIQQRLGSNLPVALVFSGNGSQWQGMGNILLEREPIFAQTIDEIDAIFSRYSDFSIKKELLAALYDSRYDETEVAQPCLFALQVATTRYLRQNGVIITAVTGHSVGEIAAAWACGALTLEQATQVIYHRSFWQGTTRSQGRMMAIALSADDARELIDKLQVMDQVSIAAINSGQSVTIAGQLTALELIKMHCEQHLILSKILDIDYAFHTSAMDPIEASLTSSLSELGPSHTHCDFISSVTGTHLSGEALTNKYWWQNIRNPVNFNAAIKTLIDRDVCVFVEVGPHPILTHYLKECVAEHDIKAGIFNTGHRKDNEHEQLASALYQTWLSGGQFDPSILLTDKQAYAPTPSHLWSKQTYRLKPTEENSSHLYLTHEHPLLGWRIKREEPTFENHLDTLVVAYLADHQVDGVAIMPAAGFCEIALAASKCLFTHQHHEIENLDIRSPLAFEANKSHQLRVSCQPESGDLMIQSRLRHQHEPWNTHAVGRIHPKPCLVTRVDSVMASVDSDSVTHEIKAKDLYQSAKALGLSYGPEFQAIDKLRIAGNQSWAKLTLSASMRQAKESHLIHPGILDACFQLLIGSLSIHADRPSAYLPVRIGRLRLLKPLTDDMYITSSINKKGKQSVLASFSICDEAGNILVLVEDCRFKKAHFERHASPTYYDTYQCRLRSFNQNTTSTSTQAINITPHPLIHNINSLIVEFLYEAIASLGNKKPFTVKTLIQDACISQQHQAYAQWAVELLHKNNRLSVDGKQRYVIQPSSLQQSAQALWKQLFQQHPELLNELLIIGRIGHDIASILNSSDNFCLAAYFDQHMIDDFMHQSSLAKGVRDAAQSYVTTALAQQAKQHHLRILDISSGINQPIVELAMACKQYQCHYQVLVSDDTDKPQLKATNAFIKAWGETHWDTQVSSFDKEPFDIIILRPGLLNPENQQRQLTVLQQCLSTHGTLLLLERQTSTSNHFIFGLESSWFNTSSLGTLSFEHIKQQFSNAQLSVCNPSINTDIDSNQLLIIAHNTQVDEPNIETTLSQERTPILYFNYSGSSNGLACSLASLRFDSIDQLIVDTEQLNNLKNALLAHCQKSMSLFITCCFDSTDLTQLIDDGAALMKLVQTITSINWLVPPKLILITRHAQSGIDVKNSCTPCQSIIWGLGRVIQNEKPQLHCKLIDAQGQLTPALIVALQEELLVDDDEQEVIITEVNRYGFRAKSCDEIQSSSKAKVDYHLNFKRAGSLANLYWQESTSMTLQPDDVRIKPHSVGLNFRDLMYTMGLIPDEAVENGFLGETLGMEFSGEVLETGSSVSQFHPGDSVMGFAPSSFSNMTVTKAHAITHLPEKWTHQQAATIPIAFFTAFYALHHLANLQPGERILIHGAAGGVGIAAIQIAQQLGAQVFATAGTATKRALLTLVGVEHCYDSRSLEFADNILHDTHNQGMDVVLNCLAGEAIATNLSIMAPFARFLELGKRDFFANSKMALRPFRNNLSYFGIDADQLLSCKPALCTHLFKQMMSWFDQDKLSPLPFRAFESADIHNVFRYMQQSKHIGKIIVNMAQKPNAIELLTDENKKQLALLHDATYLVTGGSRGFGFETAKWLIDKGARHIALVSRSATLPQGTQEAIALLASSGIGVNHYSLDISDQQAVNELIASIDDTSFPLKGIIHAAAVYEDCVIDNLTYDSMRSVLAPKALGAWNLHQATQSHNLDFLVVYSSVTTLFGNPGQANYVAANTYLEQLMKHRRDCGLPGLAVAWGPIGDSGYIARNTNVKQLLTTKLGNRLLTSREALCILEQLLLSTTCCVTVAHLNYQKMYRAMASLSTPKFSEVIDQDDFANQLSSGSSDTIANLIEGKSDKEAIVIVSDLLRIEISKILKLSLDKLDKREPLITYGMDSLMGVEFANAIEERFCIQMPMMSLSQSVTINAISERIYEKLQVVTSQEDYSIGVSFTAEKTEGVST